MEKKFAELKALVAEIHDLKAALALLEWDQQVYLPAGAENGRAAQIETLSGVIHAKSTAAKLGRLIETLEPADYPEDSTERALLARLRRDFAKKNKVPAKLVSQLARTTAEAHAAWVRARQAADYTLFAPHLARIVELKRRYAELFAPSASIYDPLLDDYEPGMTAAELDRIFEPLRREQAGLVRQLADRPADDAFLHQKFNGASQLAFSREVVKKLGYDFKRGRLDLTVHPFTTSFGLSDVRITTAVHAELPVSCLLSTVHECGHALYEQGIDPALDRTPLAEGASYAFHESQSRLWENQVARSLPFWRFFYPAFQKRFPKQLGEVPLERFYRAVNRVVPSEIRTEADEATYNLHIMLRYELELGLLEGRIPAFELAGHWNAKMQEYLGVTPRNDTVGVLQDIHWSLGDFGYFPTYALGNLIGAEIWNAACRTVPGLEEELARGNFRVLLEFLRRRVHCHGAKYEPPVLLEKITGRRSIDSEQFLTYLKGKYSAL